MTNSRRRALAVAASAAAAIAIPATKSIAQLVAFPGAEGFGALATGGRSGSVYVVTNLNNSGTGSFEDAVSQSNRIVVFAVGGYIDATAPISVASNVTILGQTAPNQGIGIMGEEVSFSDKSNDIVQYMRFRQGSGGSSTEDSVNFGDGTNMIFDHDSIEYGLYNNIDASGTNGIGNDTIQNSIIADPIKGQQFNFHIQGYTSVYPDSITIANNIFTNAHNRNPLAKANDQYVNNVVYNFQAGYTVASTGGVYTQDIINNYFITGPSTTSAGDAFYQMDSNISVYASGNLEDSNKDGVLNGSALSPGGVTTLTTPGLPGTSALPTLSTAAAYAFDTTHSGASLSYDAVDTQVIGQVESLGTQGSIYNSQGDTGTANGGYGTILGGTPPTSTAGDGIPDTWAVTHGLSITDTSSAVKKSALGYDMIEEYADQLADTLNSQTWSAGAGEWTTNGASWSSTSPGIYDHALVRGTGTADGSVTISNSGATAFSLSIGGNGLSAGESAYVTGGSLTVYTVVTVGDQNNGLLQVTGGVLNAGDVQLGNTVWDSGGNPTTYTGTLNLNGGTLETQEVVRGGGAPSNWTTGSNWTWSGGTLEAGPGGLLASAPANIGSGGAILNTNSATATLSGVLSGSGSFTKNGAGLAILSATNTYTGGSTINTGAVEATKNQALGTQTVTINVADGLQLANGVSLANPIVANGGSSEVVDVPFASASATVSGNISLASQSSDQYRVGISGSSATLTLTGASTVNSAISLITRGNVIFAQSGSLNVSNNGVEIGRYSSTSSLNLTVRDNASITATSIALGGLNGSSDDLNTNVTLLGNGALNAQTGSFNLDNSLTASNTTTLTLSGSSNIYAGNIVETSTAAVHAATVNLNGGTINATANDPGGGSFLPALNAATFNVMAGASVNNGGFNITIAQLLLGTTNDGGFTSAGNGTTTLLGADTYNGPTKVLGGTLIIGGSSSLPTDNTVINNSSVIVAANATADTVTGTGALAIGTGTATATLHLANGSGTSDQSSLVISPGSALDIGNNRLIINYGSGSDPIATIAAWIENGYYGLPGPAIISSAVATDDSVSGLSYGIGYADGNDGTVVGLTSGEIEIMYTLLGDANLDGTVNSEDFTHLSENLGQPGGWDDGDFNYDGTVNTEDFTSFAPNLNQSATLAAQAGVLDETDRIGDANVPEPVGGAVFVAAGMGILLRRFSRKSRDRSLGIFPLGVMPRG